MNKKLILIAAIGAIGAFAANAAYDGRINIGANPGNVPTSPGGGGPFKLTVVNSQTAAMNAVVAQGSQFLSFCLERNENINLNDNQQYFAKIGSGAVDGGWAGGNPDPISAATEYLYTQFRAGASGYTTPQQRADLQNAIWWLEEELQSNPLTAGGQTLVNNAKNAIFGVNAVVTDAVLRSTLDTGNKYNVVVLNLYGKHSDAGVLSDLKQSQLAIVPEPSTYIAGGLALLPLLFGLRTRIAKK